MNRTYKFCPNCKGKLSKKENKIFCTTCNFVDYFDPAPAVSVILVKDNKILIAIRGIEPFKGKIDLVGGFLKAGESAEDAVIRETFEETGLKVKISKYIGSYPDTYGKDGGPVIGIVFIVKIISGKPKANDDVANLKWILIKDIPKLKFIGFKGIRKALMDFYRLHGRGAEN